MAPPGKQKERFNAKARQSSAGSSHKKRKAVKVRTEVTSSNDADQDGSNAISIDPELQRQQREAEQRRRELLALSSSPGASDAPISSKKRKRLDAYIARQLKKEKRQQLIADLAESSAQVTDRSTLQSAATLGTGKAQTGQERIDKDVAREERVLSKRRPAYEVVSAHHSDDDEGSDDGTAASEDGEAPHRQEEMVQDHDGDERQARIARARALFSQPSGPSNAQAARTLPQPASTGNAAIGSALALGPDGKPLIPVMKKRKKQTRKPTGRRTAWGRVQQSEGDDDYDGESDFNSSASSDQDEDESDDGLDSVSDDVGLSSDSTDKSVSHLSDSEFGAGATDDEEQAILEEAMRLRGMLGHPSRPAPTEDDFHAGSNGKADDKDEDELAITKGDIPFTQFGEDEEDEDESAREPSGEDDDDDDEDGDDSSEDESIEHPTTRRGLPKTERSQGFKSWAMSALGMGESQQPAKQFESDDVYKGPEPVAGMSQRVGDLMDGKVRGPLGREEAPMEEMSAFAQAYYKDVREMQASKKSAKSYSVNVQRSEEVQEARLKLPVLAEEDRIVRTIMENTVTILCGETGSGKTTQVPQFLYEYGFGTPGSANPGLIGVTQPRRVAALSMAKRVSQELGLGPDRVSHQIRYDATVSSSTNIKFMTDGVLLRELATDFLLQKYSAIIIDEAHERSVNTDVLIGVLSRVARLRAKKWIAGEGKPLRLVIMSATLRVDDFAGNSRLFDQRPPIVQVDARQYPVTTHFNRRTTHDYLGEAVKKACKIHARLPAGGILIFLTGQAEIATVCRRLEKRFGRQSLENRRRRRGQDAGDVDNEQLREDRVILAAKDGDVEVEDIELSAQGGERTDSLALDVDGDADGVDVDDEALDSDGDDDDVPEYDADLPQYLRDNSDTPMHILPLYSLLPSDRQMLVFAPPPAGSRLVVVATNVAETSLTIPGITYVVDCGRAKDRKYDAASGIQSFEVGFISKASADQRSGRAGRTGPGHCYRLYSSNVYEEHFASFAQPEILRMPVDNLVLMMKSMNIDNVSNFPFPTPPDREAIQRAERLLLRLGALETETRTAKTMSASQYKITELGRSMSLFPLGTRLSKLLVQGHQHDCLALVVALVAVLSVADPFVREDSLQDPLEEGAQDDVDLPKGEQADKDIRRARRSAYHKALNRFTALSGALSDPLRLLSAVAAYELAGGSVAFCREHYLVPKTMDEIHKLRIQIASIVQANAAPSVDVSSLHAPTLKQPTTKQLSILRQFLTSAFIDQIAVRADLSPDGAARVPMLQQQQGYSEAGAMDRAASKQFYQMSKQGGSSKMQSTRNVAYLAAGVAGEACFIHKSSVLHYQQPPAWILFSQVSRGRAKGDMMEVQGRNWLKGVTAINPNWIYKLGPTLCTLSNAIETDHRDTRAKLIEAAQALKRRGGAAANKAADGAAEKDVYLVPTYGTGPAFDASERSAHVGWELPAIAAKQRLIHGKWVTEVR